MKVIKKKILEYLELTILTKKGMLKRIYELEQDLKEARKNEQYAIDQMNKFKKLNQKLRRKKYENTKRTIYENK